VQLGTGWQGYDKVFSGGDGVVYAIRSDGVLERRKHQGYLDGSSNWGAKEEIGTGWGDFREVVAAAEGVLYAFTRDGRILWYRYGKRPPLPPEQRPEGDSGLVRRPMDLDLVVAGGGGGGAQSGALGGLVTEFNPAVVVTRDDPNRIDVVTRPDRDLSQYLNPDAELWEGPVEMRRNFPAFRSVFVRMAAPYRGPN
jgi:hypothetical protein